MKSIQNLLFQMYPLLSIRLLFLIIYSSLAAFAMLELIYAAMNFPGILSLSNAVILLITAVFLLSTLFKRITQNSAPVDLHPISKYLSGTLILTVIITTYIVGVGTKASFPQSLYLSGAVFSTFLVLSIIENNYRGNNREQPISITRLPETQKISSNTAHTGKYQAFLQDVLEATAQLTSEKSEFLSILDTVILWEGEGEDRNLL